jgi:HEAT repeat protein
VLALLAGCAGLLRAPEPAVMDAGSYSALASLEYGGSQRALERLDRSIAAAGKDPDRVAGLVSGMVQVLRQPQATFDARQAICQRLGQLLGAQKADDATLAVLAPMLSDARLVNAGRLALEPVGGPKVDALFVRALEGASGPTRLALVQSVGNRRMAEAVRVIAPLLADADGPTAEAAAKALGSIGTAAALAALEAAPSPSSPAVVEARLACIAREPVTDGSEALRAIYGDAGVPKAQRAAAWRGLLVREPSAATQRVVVVLEGSDPAFKQVALEAIASLRSADLVQGLCENLVAFDHPTQAAVIEALARKGDPAAVATLLSAAKSADASVREAAIAALGMLPGSRDVAMSLAEIAEKSPGREGSLAFHSLARLSGPGVGAAVLAGAAGAEPAMRAVFLGAIGQRGMTEGDPLLVAALAASDPSVRRGALRSLEAIGAAGDQGAILAWLVGSPDRAETGLAIRALVNVTKRNPDAAGRDRPVTDALDSGTPAVRLRLLPVLPRLGDGPAADCALRLALASESNVAATAAGVLAQWPGDAALSQLVEVSERSADSAVRSAALRGAMRAVERRRSIPSREPSDLVARLLARASDEQDRRQLVLLLSRGSSDAALSLARKLQSDPVLGADAKDAVLAIRANRDWPPALTASAGAERLADMVDGDPQTAWWAPASPNRWIRVDFGRSRPVRVITLDQTGRVGDFPERYEVFVTDDPDEPGVARAAGAGETGKTVIRLPQGIRGRYVVIRDASRSPEGTWSVTELQVD